MNALLQATSLFEVALSLAILIIAVGISISLVIWASKKRSQTQEEPVTMIDAATSLHRDLDQLRNARFGRPMHQRFNKINKE